MVCISAIKICIYFKKGIVNLISDRDYQVNKDIMKLLFIIFYQILIANIFSFESNDENILIIFIDILYLYLKSTNTHVDNELENELEFIKKEKNTPIENYQLLLKKLLLYLSS